MFGHIKMMPKSAFDTIAVNFASLTASSSPTATGGGSGLKKLHTILNDQGVAVVTDVIAPQEVNALESAFANDIRAIIDIPESTKKTMKLYQDPLHSWNTETHPLSRKARAFATDFGLPHGKCAWRVRLHPNVKKVYELLFSTQDLCVSADNVFFSPNEARGDPGARKDRLWPHADQNIHQTPQGGFDSFQGILYLWGADANSSSTVVWPGSHRTVYPRLIEAKGRIIDSHYVPLGRKDFKGFVEYARRVPVPAGSLLVWNSKIIHQGWSHGKRLAVPVCYEPRARRPDAALESKVKCCHEGVPTTHWASLGIPHRLGDSRKVEGGTSLVPLVARAHRHILSGEGELDSRIRKLL